MESDEKYGDGNLEAKLAVETVTNSHPLDCRWSAFDRKTYTSHYTTSINQLSGIRAILNNILSYQALDPHCGPE